MTEQKPSSRKVSIKVRRKGLHSTHRTMLLEQWRQHGLPLLKSRWMNKARSKKSIRINQVRMKTPELSRSLTDS